MHKFKIIFVTLLVTGCAPPKTWITNIQPQVHVVPIKNTVSFEQGKGVIWNDILTKFSHSEFSIDKINMDAHMVKFRYSGQPDLYIDCGIKTIKTDGDNKIISNATKSYSYRAYQHIHLETYSISNSFTGYVNLVFTGNDISSRALVQFNLELETDENLISTRGPQFSTNKHGKIELSFNKPIYSEIFKTDCRSTGDFERKVFEIISQIQRP